MKSGHYIFLISHLNKYIKRYVFIFSLFFSIEANAANKTFTGPGNFSDNTKWSGSSLPVAGDNLRINGTCTFDNSANNYAYGTLNIGYSAVGTLNWPSSGTNTLNVSNVSSSNGTSNLTMTNGGTLKIRGTFSSSNLAFTPGAGTLEFTATITLPSAYTTYNNLTVNGSGITTSLGVNTTITGSLTVTTGTISAGAFNLNVTGTTTISSTYTITSASGSKTFGNLIINGGTFNNTAANVPITINGNFQNDGTFNSGTGLITFTGATSNTITGTAASTSFAGGIVVNKGSSYSNVLDVQSVITIPSGGLTLTNGTLKISSASTLSVFTTDIASAPYLIPSTAGLWVNGGTVSTTCDVSAAGLIRVSNGTFNLGNATDQRLLSSWATIIIDGGAFNISGRLSRRTTGEGHYFTMSNGTLTMPTSGSTSTSYPPFTMDDAGSSFTMSGGTIVIQQSSTSSNLGYINLASTYNVTGGTLQIGNGSTPAANTMKIESSAPIYNLNVNSSNATATLQTYNLSVKGNVDITSGTLNSNSLDISVEKNWINNSTFTQGTGNVNFSGTTVQNISGTTSTTFYTLTLNNTYATKPQITASAVVNVSNSLTLTTGVIQTSATNYLSMLSGSTTTIGSASSYIDGTMNYAKASSGSSTLKIPIGSSTYWRPMEITVNHATATSYTYTVSLTNGSALSLNYALPANVVTVSRMHYWDISRSSTLNLTSASVKFYYGSDDGVADPSYLTVVKNSTGAPSTWTDVTGTASGTSSGSIVSGSFTAFNRFALGNLTGGNNPLPVKLITFIAKPKNNSIDLNWSTASEINNDHFTIERSIDGIIYEPIFNVSGSENSTITNNYLAIDRDPFEGQSYYRLKQTDRDGYTELLKTIAVNLKKKGSITDLNVQANNEGIKIYLKGSGQNEVTITLLDITGKLYYSKIHSLDDGATEININVNLKSGLYLLNAIEGEKKYLKKFVIS